MGFAMRRCRRLIASYCKSALSGSRWCQTNLVPAWPSSVGVGPAAVRSIGGTLDPAPRLRRSPTAVGYGDSDVEPMDFRPGVCPSGMASAECDGVQAREIIRRERFRSKPVDS
jgi:hypothetical protein